MGQQMTINRQRGQLVASQNQVSSDWCKPAQSALTRSTSIAEVKDIHDKARVYQEIARRAKLHSEQNEFAELKIECEAKIGQLLQATITHGGAAESHTIQLKDHRITKQQSLRFRRIASVPPDDRQKWYVEKRKRGGEISSAGIYRLAKNLLSKNKRAKLQKDACRFAATGNDSKIIHGDMAVLFDVLKASSVDLILTDPPYGDVEHYDRLARLAKDKLRNGGLCVAYTGLYHLDRVMAAMGAQLDYWWQFVLVYKTHTPVHQRHVYSKHKVILVYGKPPLQTAKQWTEDVIESAAAEKELHDWQQPITEARELIRRLSSPRDLVVDPFAGSGTTLVAAKELGRRWLGTEIDANTAAVARKRVMEQPPSTDGVNGEILGSPPTEEQ